jgi:hypothetical protein
MAKRGRKIGSPIRQQIVEILFWMKKGTGYDIYKIHKQLFPQCTQRSIYYHLQKGVDTQEFLLENVRIEEGDYSWGKQTQKVYYELGPHAEPKILNSISDPIKRYLDSHELYNK